MSDAPSLRLERASDVGYLNLRGDPTNTDFLEVLESKAGIALPVAANTVVGAGRQVYWLGPDEWLVVGTCADIAECRTILEQVLSDYCSATNDLSGGLVKYQLRGHRSRQLLAKGCTLDLHPDVFTAGACAQTGLAKASVILSLPSAGDGYDIIVRRSFADYVWQWLLHAGRNLGIEVA